MKYSDIQRIVKIKEYAEKLMRFLDETSLDKDTLTNDYKMPWAVTTPLYPIGEHVYYLSNEYKAAHSEVDWHLVSGLRHRLVHDYDDTNWEIISEIVFDDIPVLIEQMKKILSDEKTE